MTSTYIINGKIVTPDEVVSGKALAYCEDCGKIIGIVDEVPAGAKVIDACGNYVAPGLVDVHIHGYLGEDASDGKADGVRTMAYGIAKNGVTSFLPTTMTVSKDEIVAALNVARSRKEESKTWAGAEILGVHAEGPFINPSKKGAQAAENILAPDADFVLENADIIKQITIAPEMDKDHACIKKLYLYFKSILELILTSYDKLIVRTYLFDIDKYAFNLCREYVYALDDKHIICSALRL